MGDESWMGIGPGAVTGFGAGQADSGSGGVGSGVESTVVTRGGANAPLYSPDNPLFWVGVLLLATFGLIHVSTNVKAGPLKGAASI
jgi:hypothetical protein